MRIILKKQKEQEAKELLDSIDKYLLDELGIALPNPQTHLQNRIWTAKFSELSGARFDPSYHQRYYQDLEKALTQSIYPLVNLSQIIISFKKGIEVGSKAYSQTKEIPFIRVSDINNEGINYDKVEKFITASLYENLKSFQPQQNELLYSKDGTIGFCLMADTSRDYIVSGGILRLEFKKESNIDFVQNILASHLLNILANRKAIGAVIKHLGISEFLNLKIPLPPLAIQEKLVHSMQECKEKATLLKNQAKAILNTAKIDVENMILTASAGGGILVEIDFDVMQKALENLNFNVFDFENELQSVWQGGRYKVKPLKDFILKSVAGVWGYDENEIGDFSKYKKCLVIRSTEFDNNFGINLNSSRIKYRYIERRRIEKLCISEGDILVEKSGGSENQPVGRVAYITKELSNIQIGFSNFIQKITLNNEVLKEFIYCYLSVVHSCKMTQKFQSQTNGIRNLIMQEYINLKIPIPPLAIQEQIVSEINSRRESKRITTRSQSTFRTIQKNK